MQMGSPNSFPHPAPAPEARKTLAPGVSPGNDSEKYASAVGAALLHRPAHTRILTAYLKTQNPNLNLSRKKRRQDRRRSDKYEVNNENTNNPNTAKPRIITIMGSPLNTYS